MRSSRWSPGLFLLIGSAAWATDTPWIEIVEERIGSQARAIYWHQGTARATLPGLQARATFTDDEVLLTDDVGTLLSLSFVGWGRDGAWTPLGAEAPAEGACLPDVGVDGQCIRRLEREFDGVTEWWVGLEAGLEQGWTLDAAPPGTGLIRFETAVGGALLVDADGEQGWLTDVAGQQWTVTELAAWDATGAPLDVRIDAAADRLIVSVDDTGAVYPIVVDPLYTTATTVLSGYDPDDRFGAAVADAGDVNTDGFDDVIVGAPELYDIGAVYVFLGSASGVSITADTSLPGDGTNDDFGAVVSTAGDINDDGYDDVIVGAPGADSGAGAVYLYTGAPGGLSGGTEVILNGGSAGDAFGYSVGDAGDVNGDGFDDIIVGAPGLAQAQIFRGANAGIVTSADATLSGTGSFGYAVAGAGDIDGDGYDDVIVGNGVSTAVYAYVGTALGLDTLVSSTLSVSGGSFGEALAGAGDVNGDGYDDIIVGDGFDATAYVYHGSAAGLSSAPDTTLTGSGLFGFDVDGVGDINGDGYDDVLVSDPISAEVTLHNGSAAGVIGVPETTLTETALDYGDVISAAGDVNGDGYRDVIVGAPGANSDEGEAYIYHGYCTDEDGDEFCVYDDCDDTDPKVNVETLWYVDADGDGYGDASLSVYDCTPPSGYVGDNTDCDDTESRSNPGEKEVCDDIDNDCDGRVDEDVLLEWYVDADGDGYGDDEISVEDCEQPSGYVADDTDCNDKEALTNPGNKEVCDYIDNDCDNVVDEDVTNIYYADLDSDTFGNALNTIEECTLPSGYVEDDTDCNDQDDTIYPGAEDAPNDGIDSNCDGYQPIRWVQGGASCATAPGGRSLAGLAVLLLLTLRRRKNR